jgi:hypothetical protein
MRAAAFRSLNSSGWPKKEAINAGKLKLLGTSHVPSVSTDMHLSADGELQILPFFPPKPTSSQTWMGCGGKHYISNSRPERKTTHLLADVDEPTPVDASAGFKRRFVVGPGANDADGAKLG